MGPNLADLYMVLQVALAGLLASAIGLQRHRRGRPAGMRTHAVVAMAAACFTFAGTFAFGSAEPHDPTRIAAQVVSAIGFLGAGTIIHSQDTVIGLTTAATLWFAAAQGILVGAGASWLAIGATVLAFLMLTLGQSLQALVEESESAPHQENGERDGPRPGG